MGRKNLLDDFEWVNRNKGHYEECYVCGQRVPGWHVKHKLGREVCERCVMCITVMNAVFYARCIKNKMTEKVKKNE